jgi:hypothetical protein
MLRSAKRIMRNYLRRAGWYRIHAGGMKIARCGKVLTVSCVARALLFSSAIVVRVRRKRADQSLGLNPSASELRYARHAGTSPTSTPALSTTPM